MAECDRLPGWNTNQCCCSCHEDEDMGYDCLCEVEWNGKTYLVCCRAANEWKQLDEIPDQQTQHD